MRYKDFYSYLLTEASEQELVQIDSKIESLKRKFDSERKMAMLWSNPEYKALIQQRDVIISKLDGDEKELEEYKIKGEYWIQDGYAQFADGSIGDDGHESVAVRHAQGIVLNYLGVDSDELEGRPEFDNLIEQGLIENDVVVSEDYDLEEDLYTFVKDSFSESEANKCRELYRIASHLGDARMYAKKNWGWITVHGNSIGLHELNEKTIRSLIRGIDQIISENGDDDVTDNRVELSIGADKTNSRRDITLEELKERTFGTGGSNAYGATKSDVINKLDKSIQHPFYKDRIDENSYLPKFLYHATLKAFSSSIQQHGIVAGGKECKLFDWCSSDYVYLAGEKELAESFIALSTIEIDDEDRYRQLENLFNEGGVTYKIDVSKLDNSLIEKDPNWNSTDDDSISVVYKGIIPISAIVSKSSFIPD